MMSLTEEQLIEMSGVFDEFLLEFCNKYSLSPLATSGLILARLAKLSKEIGYTEQYKKLLTDVIMINEDPSSFISNNSSSIH